MPRKNEQCLNLGNFDFKLQLTERYTPLRLFYIELCIVCTKKQRFVEYTPRKCFNSFVQSAVDVGRHKEIIPNSSVVVETTKLLPKCYYGYQVMDRSRHVLTKDVNDEKTHAAFDSKLLKKPTNTNEELHEIHPLKQKYITNNHSLSGFSSLNTQNFECWKTITVFSQIL